MKAFKFDRYIIAAEVIEEAVRFFRQEVGGPFPQSIEEVDWLAEVSGEGGEGGIVRDLVNKELDERNAWLRMGIPCDLYWPFIIAKLPPK